jgi:GTP-binding protein LepA
MDTNEYDELKDSIEKLKLNDASLTWQKDSSVALGHGFRCGFLGLLHLEVVQERLEREFDQSVIFTAPSVEYRIHLRSGETILCDNPADYPDEGKIEAADEPYIKASIITPTGYLGNIMSLCVEKRGVQTNMQYLDEKRVEIVYEMPLAEVLFDFLRPAQEPEPRLRVVRLRRHWLQADRLVKIDILINGKPVDALSQLAFKGKPTTRRATSASS